MSENKSSGPQFVLPTSFSVNRYQQMKIEAVLNTEYKVTDDKSPLEFTLLGEKNVALTLDLLKLPESDAEVAQDLLEEALEGGELDEIYGLRGGILCLLLPMPVEEDDFSFTRAQQEGKLHDFMHAPHEFFSALTPAQIWAGAGKHELALADHFLPTLFNEMKEKAFPTEGALNTEWLSRLRLWTYNPAHNYRGRVVDVIQSERNEQYKKRLEWAEASGIKLAFEPV